jgi:hypothetical protein
MSVVVFLGPSLSPADARSEIDATFLPPVRAGDIVRALALQPEAIAIVDGYFDRVPSVWHKEILYALSRGVAVYGASSMGALRAAELHPYGMIGVGRIFEAFCDGVLEDDDEVAIVHGPAESGYRAASDAMVNIRMGLARAEALGAIEPATADALVQASKATFYADRSWRGVLEDAIRCGIAAPERESLARFIREARPDQKREDALELLRRLAARDLAERTPVTFEFHPTSYWLRLVEEMEHLGSDGSGSTASELAVWSRVRSGGNSDVVREAAVLYLISEAVHALGLRVSEDTIRRARVRLQERGLSADDLEELAATNAVLETVERDHSTLVDGFVRLALAKRGELAAAQNLLARRHAMLRGRGFEEPDLRAVGLSTEALLGWYSERTGVAEPTPEALASRLGIKPRKMLDEILRLYLDSHARGERVRDSVKVNGLDTRMEVT